MPKIAIYKFLTFFIVSFDTLREPPHLHVVKERGGRVRAAKVWLRTLEVAEKGSLSEKELNLAVKLIAANQQLLLSAFEKAADGVKFKPLQLKLK